MRDYKNSSMAILVIGFDGYSDLWDDYFGLLNKFWPNRKYPTFLSNNVLKPHYENVSVINCGHDAEWSRKVKLALEVIDNQYICLLLEDFFTGDVVINEEIDDAIEFISNNNVKYYKLNSFSKVNSSKYKKYKYLHTIPGNLPYGVSLQPAIWEKRFLEELLGNENYNAWKFEYARVKESLNKTNFPLEGCVFDDRNILKIQHGVVQGQFLPPVVKYFEKRNYVLDTSKRKIMSTKDYVIYRLKINSKTIIPIIFQAPVKKVLKLFGLRFVSDKHA